MSRVKISEYRAKKVILGDTYRGVHADSAHELSIPEKGHYVVKVDQGIKKRFKKGLVGVNCTKKEVLARITEWKKKGYTDFLVEPFVPHEANEERYISLERVREGVRVLYSAHGGIDIEENNEALVSSTLCTSADAVRFSQENGIPESFMVTLFSVFDTAYFAFLEINPFIIQKETVHVLDAAVLVDSAAAYFVAGVWSEADFTEARPRHEAEEAVLTLSKTTPASLKLTVLQPDGALFLLLSGGGGSIVIGDAAALKGAGGDIANYGEYSGGPTRQETHLYSREIVRLLLASRAKKRALVIAGGVANFTDVLSTFDGIIDALSERASELQRAGVRVFIRRGGPNEAEGLSKIRSFLSAEGLLGSVHGSESEITRAVDEGISFIRT